MAIITYPLNGIEYLAEDAETYLCTRTSGVFAADGHFAATATGESRQVSISQGLAWIKNSAYAGKSVLNDGTIILEHDIADGTLSRIDRIVLRFDKSANLSEIAIKKGNPSSKPVPPSIERSELIYELGLYEVSIPAASTVLTQANVKSTILDETVCGIMRDGVTGIPTNQLQEQAAGVIEDIAVQFNQFIGEKDEEFYTWFNQLTEILDENVAANLLNLINQNTSDIQGLKDDTKELSDGILGMSNDIQGLKDNTGKLSNDILGVSNDLQNFKDRTDNPHSVTAEQVGAVSKNGDTMTDKLTIQHAIPQVYLEDTDANTRAYISNIGTTCVVAIQNGVGDTANQRQLYITSSASENYGDLSNALRLRTVVNGSATLYKVLHTANLTLPVVSTTDGYEANQLRNIQFGTANTPTTPLINGAIYLQHE